MASGDKKQWARQIKQKAMRDPQAFNIGVAPKLEDICMDAKDLIDKERERLEEIRKMSGLERL